MSVNNVDFSTLTVAGTALVMATACSPAMPSQAKGAIITLEDGQIRWRDDGDAPSSTEGHSLYPTDVLILDSWSVPKVNWRQVLRAIQVIRVTATSGALKISWFD